MFVARRGRDRMNGEDSSRQRDVAAVENRERQQQRWHGGMAAAPLPSERTEVQRVVFCVWCVSIIAGRCVR